ncbi:MAG: Ferredoxin, 2Fe-2S [Myxococcota bacterium]|nr:Ferredoxin, 2Fe-2S [Myxococcota bacterium]
MSLYQRHAFVCINERDAGNPRGSCAAKGAAGVHAALKSACAKLGLDAVRVNKSGCLDFCENGVTVVIYPEGVWYRGVTEADAREIAERTIRDGQVIERLLLTRGNMIPPKK